MKMKGAVTGICIVDAILLAVCAFLYLNQDRTAPVISFGENDVVYTEGMDTGLLLAGVTAVDDVDGDVTDTLLIEKISDTARGDVLVTYVALDRANNVAKASQIFPAQSGSAGGEGGQPVSPMEEGSGVPETETETMTASGDNGIEGDNNGNQGEREDRDNAEEGQGNRQDGNGGPDGQARQDEGRNNPDENGQNEAGADMNRAGEGRDNAAPVLRLGKEILTVKAGAESVNWNDCIGSLSDDKDNRALLFSNLAMEGLVDLGTPGEYPVTIYTRDSEGAESEKRNVVVRVE